MVCEVAVGLMGIGSLALVNHCLKQSWMGMAWMGGAAAVMCGFLLGVTRGQDIAIFAVTAAALSLAAMVVAHRRRPKPLAAAGSTSAIGAAGA
jgi:hypothetical protein